MTVSLYSLTVVQATMGFSTTEDPKEMAIQRAKYAPETITYFDARTSNDKKPTTSSYSPASAGAAYLLDVAARPAHKRQNIRPDVVRMKDDFGILVVNRIGDRLLSNMW